MRLFIAIRFTDEVKKALLGTMHDLKQKGIKGNYTAGANLHLTLAFIGETRDKEEVIRAMERVSFTPFRLSVRELGTFGDILWDVTPFAAQFPAYHLCPQNPHDFPLICEKFF